MAFELIMQKCCDWPLFLAIYSWVSLSELLIRGITFSFVIFNGFKAKMTIRFHGAERGFFGGFGLFVLKEGAAQAV